MVGTPLATLLGIRSRRSGTHGFQRLCLAPQMSIFCLPVELIQSIAEETPAKDLACLRATCSLVNAAVEPFFFSEIVLNDHTCYPRPLQTLATSKAASQYARRLFISFSFRPEFAMDGLGMATQSVRSHLEPAIRSLKGLHTVRSVPSTSLAYMLMVSDGR